MKHIALDFRCLAFGGPDGSRVYGLVEEERVYVLVQAETEAHSLESIQWRFVGAALPLRSLTLPEGDISCILNKAGEFTAMGAWNRTSSSVNRIRGLVYNPYNPDPPGSPPSTRASWMRIDVASNTDANENEIAQLILETGEGNSLQVVLEESRLTFRNLTGNGLTERNLHNIQQWNMSSREYFGNNAQLRYSNNFLYSFNADSNNAASLMKIPFVPNSAELESPDATKLPLGATFIDITSTIGMCDWQEGYFTAVSGNEFFLLCQVQHS
ncbi:hypothetical protein BGZ70_006777 [Mortierella alpina]|uniref:Uncharacterized protein n=1 Tax=Mortierella alpina TaxID=64518 RepID=A0A9P6J7T1_MORAP|nr:hypothetical protein BGZ70_006777 [Mortierella alpina]